jgi:sugar/nucleoside kinase (ribokinase family)
MGSLLTRSSVTVSKVDTGRLLGVMHSDVAFNVPMVDPVGAGDAFVAGYLALWLDGADAADTFGTESGA